MNGASTPSASGPPSQAEGGGVNTSELLIAFGLGVLSSIAGNVVYDAYYQEARRNGGKTPMSTVALGVAGAAVGGLLIYEIMRVRRGDQASGVRLQASGR